MVLQPSQILHQEQEAEHSSRRNRDRPPAKRPWNSSPGDTTEEEPQREAESHTSKNNADPLGTWIQTGRWPSRYFEQDDQTRRDFKRDFEQDSWDANYWEPEEWKPDTNMNYLLPRKKSSSSLLSEPSNDGSTTSKTKSSPSTQPSFKTILATKGSFMGQSDLGITDTSKRHCQTLLGTAQSVPQNTLFCDDLFDEICESVQAGNKEMLFRDISPLICPSAQILMVYGAKHLKHLYEYVDERWVSSIPLTQHRPRPDYTLGFGWKAFTNDQRAKMQPFTGHFSESLIILTSYFMATFEMFFPFLTCECDFLDLDIADRRNAHSMTIAVRGIVELFKLVKREKELDREILAFSISHDLHTVRIFGHYPVIETDKTTFYRHPIRDFSFTDQDGKEKWTAYKFTKNVYDIWMPTHLARICSVIDELPAGVNFEVSEQSELSFSEASGHSQELESYHLSIADSVSPLKEHDSQSSLGD